MSMYGSNPKLATLGQRSGSRPDLSTLRNDVFLSGGNGYQGEYQDGGGGGYAFTSTFSRSSMHGGGFGGQKMSMGGGLGGGMGGGGGGGLK